VLAPYVAAGVVTYHPWPHGSCLKAGKGKVDWGAQVRTSQNAAENAALRRCGVMFVITAGARGGMCIYMCVESGGRPKVPSDTTTNRAAIG
jgi:hypothetical protein